MSHNHERKEKVCLNCGAEIHGRYCHVCGQENLEPKETVWHMLRHIIEDITHFDGKFFSTLRYLLLRPGFLSLEYMKGRRASYLHPMRMYLFTSALFFLVFFSFFAHPVHYDEATIRLRDSLEQQAPPAKVSNGLNLRMNVMYSGELFCYLQFNHKYAVNGEHVYDSIQHSLPDSAKDNIIRHFFYRRSAAAASIYHKDPNQFMEKMTANFFHSLAKIFFFCLPLFALCMQLLFWRKKEVYFAAHVIFSLHFFCASFFFIFLICLFTLLAMVAETWLIILAIIVLLGMFAYLYAAMLRFYRQHWLLTFLKFLFQASMFAAMMIVFTAMLWFNSIFSLV